VSVPILGLKTVSEMNMHEHWHSRLKRSKHQKSTVSLVLRGTVTHMMLSLAPLRVTMTRIAPSVGLDSDNMVSSQKYVRDAIAESLGVNDKDPRVEWVVNQEKGPWGIRIRIEAR